VPVQSGVKTLGGCLMEDDFSFGDDDYDEDGDYDRDWE
jgi:hypothetical protein